jgi:hypothetical protein
MMLDGEEGGSYDALRYPEASAIKMDSGAYAEEKEDAIQMI